MDRSNALRLLSYLNNTDLSMGLLHERFLKEFNEDEQFQIYYRLSILFVNGIFSHVEQIAAFYYLYNSFDLPIEDNPFYQLFIYILESHFEAPNEFSPALTSIVHCLINKVEIPNIQELTIPEILAADYPSAGKRCAFKSDIVRSMIYENTNDVGKEKVLTHDDLLLEMLTTEAVTNKFQPKSPNTIPDIYPITPEEIEESFISTPFLSPPMLYDDPRSNASILFAKAQVEKISEKEQNELIRTIKTTPSFLKQIEPKALEYICENSLEVAKAYVENWSVKHIQIYDEVAAFPITLCSVELVKFCTSLPNAPPKFLDKWAISAMSDISSSGTNGANKSRIFCRFAAYFINQGSSFAQSVKINLQSLCLDLSKDGIEEAKELFAQL